SSIIPVAKIIHSANNNAHNCSIGYCFLNKRKLVTLNARKIANPPIVGIGTLFTRRAFGLSTAPTLNANNLINGVKIADRIIVANRDAIILYILSSFLSSNYM